MNIQQFAESVLKMSADKRTEAIRNLKEGLILEPKWNAQHKKAVRSLVGFLESDSNNIADLDNYISHLE